MITLRGAPGLAQEEGGGCEPAPMHLRAAEAVAADRDGRRLGDEAADERVAALRAAARDAGVVALAAENAIGRARLVDRRAAAAVWLFGCWWPRRARVAMVRRRATAVSDARPASEAGGAGGRAARETRALAPQNTDAAPSPRPSLRRRSILPPPLSLSLKAPVCSLGVADAALAVRRAAAALANLADAVLAELFVRCLMCVVLICVVLAWLV